MKYVKSFLEEFKKTPIFTMRDLKKFLMYNGSTKNYPRIFINLMIKDGKAYRVTKGFYTLYRNIEVVGFPFYPFYYGLSYALTIHKLWTQQANPHVLTTKNVRRGIRTTFGSNFTVSKISKTMFFGYYSIIGVDFYYPISDIEKTLIDCIYYRFNLEDYVYINIFEKLNTKKMDTYLKKCSERIRIKYKMLKKIYCNNLF